jgi:hypothetical protein
MRKADRSNQLIKITGPMNDSMYLDGIPTDHVEDEVGLDNQYAVTVFSKLGVPWISAQQRAALQEPDAMFKLRNELLRTSGTIVGYVVEDGKEIILRGGKITENMPSAHEGEPGVSPSSFCA